MDDQARREVEHLAGEREVLRPRLPERRDPLVEHAVAEQPADDAVLALHRVEVAVPVPRPIVMPGDEVVEDEVVQDDDARAPAQRLDDPAVRVRVVADVVERRRRCRAAAACAPRWTTATSIRSRERGQQERASSRRSPTRSGGIGEK